ncbi:MAG: hypothetical protein QOE84_2170 [Actinomycetota bacterium]|nr:hypothetical protein [Actinomycetota bacterium]
MAALTPFLSFRSWLVGGPRHERLGAAAVVVPLLALIAWAAVPGPAKGSDASTLAAVGGDPSTAGGAGNQTSAATGQTTATSAGPTTAGRRPGAASTTSTVRSGPATGATIGTAPGAAPGAAVAPAGADRCGRRGATDLGVTATTVTIGIVVVDLGAASNTINLPSVADQEKAYNAAFSDLNARGGIRCRKVVLRYYSDNPLDASAEHSSCLQMVQDKVFIVMNNLFSTSEQTCIPKNHIPNIWYTPPHTPDLAKYAPYVLSWQADYDKLIHHYINGANGLGFFAGMKKVGVLEGSCYPDENTAVIRELHAVGIPDSKISTFNFGCTGAPVETPDQDQAAVLQFQRDGVTHVVNVSYGAVTGFSGAADQQGYDPEFAMMEDGAATAIQSGTTKPGKSFDKALLISTIQTGARTTPGYRYSAATQHCAQLMSKAGISTPQGSDNGQFFGLACVNARLLEEAANNASDLVRGQLAGGLVRAGTFDVSYPAAPITVIDPRRPTAGQTWRPSRWDKGCNCWHVTSTTFRGDF